MESGEKTNRPFTSSNPCLCFCPTIVISVKVMAVCDIILSLVLITVAVIRLLGSGTRELVCVAVAATLAILCILWDIFLLIAINEKFRRRRFFITSLWLISHALVWISWNCVLVLTIDKIDFKKSYRKDDVQEKIKLILRYAGESITLFLLLLWMGWIMGGYVHYLRNAKIYPVRIKEKSGNETAMDITTEVTGSPDAVPEVPASTTAEAATKGTVLPENVTKSS